MSLACGDRRNTKVALQMVKLPSSLGHLESTANPGLSSPTSCAVLRFNHETRLPSELTIDLRQVVIRSSATAKHYGNLNQAYQDRNFDHITKAL